MVFPEAAALATADAAGRPAVRHVLVKGIDERGLALYTNRVGGAAPSIQYRSGP